MSEERRIMLNHVKVGERARRDIGDLTDLMESIREVGLLQPIVLDDKDRLIAGQRRLEAVRKLGWPSVPYVTAKRVKDATQHLLAERDENTCRKPMTPTEVKGLADSIRALHAAEAAERRTSNLPGRLPNVSPETFGRTDEIAAEAVGISRAQLGRIDQVVKATEHPDPAVAKIAQEAQKGMDAGDFSINAAVTKVREAQDKSAVGTLNRLNAEVRIQQITERAAKGMSSLSLIHI